MDLRVAVEGVEALGGAAGLARAEEHGGDGDNAESDEEEARPEAGEKRPDHGLMPRRRSSMRAQTMRPMATRATAAIR